MESSRRIRRRIGSAYRGRAVRERLLGLLLVGLLAASLSAQSAPVQSAAAPDANAPLPLDPAIRTGTLPNGLVYFIRANPRPAKRAMLRLVVRAGSVDEADDQRGLAHVLEHMAFNGSEHFRPGELVAYLESIGASFGPHVNAQTSFDETIYMLDVPTERSGVLQRGLQALDDFAGGISLDGDEIDRERGVVLEEWRGSLGARTRMQEPQIRALFGASKYADRLPIGTPDTLKSFPYRRLRDFYRDHYRPDRMALIVAGDVQTDAVERQVRQMFGGLTRRPGGARPVVDIPAHPETRVVSLADREQTASSASVYIKRPFEALETVATYRRMLMRSLAFSMINERLSEIARRPDAPFIGASAGVDHLGQTVEATAIQARVPDGKIADGLTGLMAEVERVRQHGFGAAELDRARRDMVASFERSYNERDKVETASLAAELIRHYLYKEAAPGIEHEFALVQQMVPTMTADEIAALARELFTDANRVVLATAPEKPGLAPTTEASLRDAMRAGLTASVTPWKDEVVARELMPDKPTPGTVRGRREIPEIGVTILTLSNGVEVWLKPTDFRNDQISFVGYARGGTSLASPAEYQNASLAADLVSLAGVGGITPVELNKLLAGKAANAATSIDTYTQSIIGSARPADLETALQLAHLRVTAPNRDADAFALLRRRLETGLANQGASPAFAYGQRLNAINTMDHYTSREMTLEDVKRLDPERMMAFYQQRFANAADFTFFVVGAFKVDDITPPLATYLGSLPSTGTATSTRGDLRMQFPAKVVRETVTRGQEPQSQTTITFFADTKLEELEDHRLGAAVGVLEGRLRNILREQLGGTYSVSASYSNLSPEPGYGVVQVQFGSAPGNVASLTKAVMSEIERLRRDGPSTGDVTAIKEQEKNRIQTSLRQNSYWLGSLQAMHQLGRDPRKILQRIERADSLSRDNIHDALIKYLPQNRHTVVTLMPEK